MAFKYEEVVPWGRSFDEYRRMFDLTEADLNRQILGCADGPASFNAQMSRHGFRVISCDPLYQFSAAQIRSRIDATYKNVIGQTRQNQDKFVWGFIKSPDDLGRVRMEAMREFLADYEQGQKAGRYVAAELPYLPFAPGSFDLALCSHFLFLYSDNLSFAFHLRAIEAMCRVAREVRIFPLVTHNIAQSPYIDPLIDRLGAAGHEVSIESVPYEFQRGGNQMMKVIAASA
jgi:hypothetical protein